MFMKEGLLFCLHQKEALFISKYGPKLNNVIWDNENKWRVTFTQTISPVLMNFSSMFGFNLLNYKLSFYRAN